MLLFLEAVKPGEIFLILIVVLLLFGGKKIPELMRGLGQGIREFKDASKGTDNKDNKNTTDSSQGQIK
jgi:sec-independent protein translocase protein TatA